MFLVLILNKLLTILYLDFKISYTRFFSTDAGQVQIQNYQKSFSIVILTSLRNV